MLNLIFGYGGYTKEKFDNAVAAQVEKLTFNTRDEYLIWVKQWKEEYKYMVALRRDEKLDRFTLPDKIALAKKKSVILHSQFDPIKIKAIQSEINLRLHTEMKRTYYHQFGAYKLIIYLLALRKASKIRAGQKMKENVKI